MDSHIHQLEIRDNSIRLDGKPVNGIRSYKIEQKEGDSLVELSLVMDVRILGNGNNSESWEENCP